MHVPPESVIAPQDRWSLTSVLYDEGEGAPCVAFGKWKDEDGDREVVTIRWNGTAAKPRGNPQSTTNPTWFVLPETMGAAVLSVLAIKHAAGSPYITGKGLREALAAFRDSEHLFGSDPL
jgi:hypothetical protein